MGGQGRRNASGRSLLLNRKLILSRWTQSKVCIFSTNCRNLWLSRLPELARKLQLQMQIDAIVKSKKNRRPKKRKKDADEEEIDRMADEEVNQLMEDMLRAAAEDDEANREKLHATSKLRLLPRVKEVLQKSALFRFFLESISDGSRCLCCSLQVCTRPVHHGQQSPRGRPTMARTPP